MVVIPHGPGWGAMPACGEGARKGVLVIGSRLPHKATAETLRLLDASARKQNDRLEVTVAGISGWEAQWGAPPREIDVSYVGRVPDAQLCRLMCRSRALVFLSEIEGFGLPLLEAYDAHTPVCYRNTSAPAEVMAGAPGGWDGKSAESFCVALDETLALGRKEIGGIRDRLLSRFNWENAAGRTLHLYAEELSCKTG
jgi:glycosyltransferase involved in cell wall biosynthesis